MPSQLDFKTCLQWFFVGKCFPLTDISAVACGRYGNLYTAKNVAISGIHTHSGPGGFLQYVLYIVTSMGFVRQSFDALADGIELAIVQAHDNLRPGSIYFNKGSSLVLQ